MWYGVLTKKRPKQKTATFKNDLITVLQRDKRGTKTAGFTMDEEGPGKRETMGNNN